MVLESMISESATTASGFLNDTTSIGIPSAPNTVIYCDDSSGSSSISDETPCVISCYSSNAGENLTLFTQDGLDDISFIFEDEDCFSNSVIVSCNDNNCILEYDAEDNRYTCPNYDNNDVCNIGPFNTTTISAGKEEYSFSFDGIATIICVNFTLLIMIGFIVLGIIYSRIRNRKAALKRIAEAKKNSGSGNGNGNEEEQNELPKETQVRAIHSILYIAMFIWNGNWMFAIFLFMIFPNAYLFQVFAIYSLYLSTMHTFAVGFRDYQFLCFKKCCYKTRVVNLEEAKRIEGGSHGRIRCCQSPTDLVIGIENWIIQLLKDVFWGMKYYNISDDNNHNHNNNNSKNNAKDNNNNNSNNNSRNWQILKQSLSKHNQMNLICVGYLLKHKYELQKSIKEIIESGKKKDKQRPAQYSQYNPCQQYQYGGGQYNSLHDNRKQAKIFKQYLQNYAAKCDSTKYFTSSPVRPVAKTDDNHNDSKHSDFVCIKKNEPVDDNNNCNVEFKHNSNSNSNNIGSESTVMITTKKMGDNDTQDAEHKHKEKNQDKKDNSEMSEKSEKSKKLIEINYELIDILRSMVIEMATVYRITKGVEDSNNNKETNGIHSQMQRKWEWAINNININITNNTSNIINSNIINNIINNICMDSKCIHHNLLLVHYFIMIIIQVNSWMV